MRKIFIGFFIMLLALTACGIYTFSPSALSGAKTIAIPQFKNKTTQYGLDDLITDQLSRKFIEDNTLRVVPEGQSDLILYGEVTKYSDEPYTYDESETVQEYICRITLKVKLQYANSDKILWQANNLSDYGIYSVTGSAEASTQDEADQLAVNKLADEILNRTVKGW